MVIELIEGNIIRCAFVKCRSYKFVFAHCAQYLGFRYLPKNFVNCVGIFGTHISVIVPDCVFLMYPTPLPKKHKFSYSVFVQH